MGVAGQGPLSEAGAAGIPSGGGAGGVGSFGEAGADPGGTGSGGRNPAQGGAGTFGSGGAGAPACDGGEVTTITADADAWISESAPTENYSTTASLEVGTMTGDRAHALVSFVIPSLLVDRTLASARLELELRTRPGETRKLTVHRILRSWRARQVDWTRASSGNNDWLTLGGDVVSAPSAQAEIPVSSPVGTRIFFDVTADVRNFVQAPENNFGWMIRHEEEGAARIELAALEFGGETPVLVLTTCP